ncbi:MAG: Unknown protein [uncultured Thiotrichaceae bacterium]|uniref:Uncharacterized protein n=1 Tax=uncultured Thiotrichaceae bacterium TaxID=298394 RepID=A0A6S6SQF5_9GAMM|nr:MAG: Unknown protein [uncultured Thiotrichaceae bacterium]
MMNLSFPKNSALITRLSIVLLLSISFSMLANIAYSDDDWDKDGVLDSVEDMLGSSPYLSDTDGDGINDLVEIGSPDAPLDTDNDGRLDVVDFDDDGDTIPTVLEGSEDLDKDNIPNYLDTDSDGDKLLDAHEVKLSYQDIDQDKVDDIFDADIKKMPDENGDGIIDSLMLHDSDKDGKPDLHDDDGKTDIVQKPNTSQEKRMVSNTNMADDDAPETQSIEEEKGGAGHVKAPAVTLNNVILPTAPAKPRLSTYMEPKDTNSKVYSGSGYFYCAGSRQVVPGITRFMVSPNDKVTLLEDGSKGHYVWQTTEPGVYALQFQIPTGMRIVTGVAKGRRLVKETDPAPLILGKGLNASKPGYIEQSVTQQAENWYTSFEIKNNAPDIKNNNIPLEGGICSALNVGK